MRRRKTRTTWMWTPCPARRLTAPPLPLLLSPVRRRCRPRGLHPHSLRRRPPRARLRRRHRRLRLWPVPHSDVRLPWPPPWRERLRQRRSERSPSQRTRPSPRPRRRCRRPSPPDSSLLCVTLRRSTGRTWRWLLHRPARQPPAPALAHRGQAPHRLVSLAARGALTARWPLPRRRLRRMQPANAPLPLSAWSVAANSWRRTGRCAASTP